MAEIVEKDDPPARDIDLAGCLPSIVYTRHGVCVTSAGWIVHWSQLDSDTVWDHMCTDLDLDNYVMLYTSKIIRKKAYNDEEKRLLLDQIINELGRKQQRTRPRSANGA